MVKYKPCRIYIKNTLEVEITMSLAAFFKNKLGVNQYDKYYVNSNNCGYFQMRT